MRYPLPLLLLFLFIFSYAVSADTNVSLTADKTELTLGETIEIQLTVDTTEPVTGSVIVDGGEQKSNLYSRSGCGCSGGPIRDHESKSLSYTPDKPGTYTVEASFKESDKIEFTVTELVSSSEREVGENMKETSTTTTVSTISGIPSTIVDETMTTTTIMAPAVTTAIEKKESPSLAVLGLAVVLLALIVASISRG